MKTRIILLLCGLLLLNSCVLKSLQPFYIQSAIHFEKALVGTWGDNKEGTWEIVSFKSIIEKEKRESEKLSKEELEVFEKYKNAYTITYEKKNEVASFIGMPFKINGKLFIDITPFEGGLEGANQLLVQHLVRTHSVAKVTINEGQSIRFDWLDEAKIKALQKAEKINLKYEKTGLDEALVLTATSEELYKFLEKFEATNNDEIWGSSDRITLKSTHAKP